MKNKFILAVIVVFLILYSLNFVFSIHTTSPDLFTINQSQYYIFNITINNTSPGQGGNITQVNITLPAGFIFVADSNATNTPFQTFINTSTVLSWTNTTNYLINGSTNNSYFWFNASAPTSIPSGHYNITVRTLNGTGFYQTNISVKVNDITPPVIALILPANASTTNPLSVIFAFNVTDYSSLLNCSLILNGTTVNVNNSGINTTGGNIIFTNTTYRLTNTWFISCVDADNNYANSSVNTFYLPSFDITGIVYDTNGIALNDSNISVSLKNPLWTDVASYSTPSNSSGGFRLSIYNNSSHMYLLSITHTNSTTTAVDWVGQSLPSFPYQEFSQLVSVNYYLKQAGTINITVINNTNDKVPNSHFSYQIKDTKLGYPVGSCSNSGTFSSVCYVPKDRNYSIMVYPAQGSPQHFVPVSFDWNNFSSTSDYTIGTSSRYNSTKSFLSKQFNVTESFARITGRINMSGIGGWSELIVIPFLLEPGNMIFMTYGILPWNASAWRQQSDVYNATSGLYNISVPYAGAETVKYLLFAAAKNGSTYYGSYRNITVSGDLNENFTMYGLLGDSSNINMTNSSGAGTYTVNTKRQTFNLVNSSDNATLSQMSAHVEVEVDYSSYNATQFTFMEDISAQSASAAFSLPLLNVTGVKEINVFSQTYAPKRVSTRTADQLISNSNISMSSFNPQAISGSLTATVNISAYKSNSTCDVSNPPAACLLNSFTPSNAMGMFSLVVGGGAISLRITYSGISVHYANVDLLASGPPDADFDSSATTSTSGSFSSAMKFGSQGPTIYDYVLVSIPYTEGSSSQTGLNETSSVNISIPTFYDESWTTPIWTTSSNGANVAALAGNYSHYSARQSEWQILMNSNNTCYSTATGARSINSSAPCHIQTADNKIWIRLPHFSGTSPTVSGLTVTAAGSPESSSGGGSAAAVFWKTTYLVSESQLQSGYIKLLAAKERIRTKIENSDHYVGIFSLTNSTATINVSSRSQQAVFNIGDEKKFEVTDDDYYDLLVKLNDIKSSKANITITSIHEKVVVPATQQQTNQTQGTTGTGTSTGEGSTTAASSIFKSTWFWAVVIVAAIILVLIILVYYVYKKRRYYKKGYGSKKWD